MTIDIPYHYAFNIGGEWPSLPLQLTKGLGSFSGPRQSWAAAAYAFSWMFSSFHYFSVQIVLKLLLGQNITHFCRE